MPSRKVTGRRRSPRRKLADELARLRAESGLSLRELADKAGWDHSHLHGMELGKSIGGPEVVEALDTVYGTTPHLTMLWEYAADGSAFRDKYQRYMELEAEAGALEVYTASTIPGLLQTEEYARELLWSTPHGPEEVDDLEDQLAARIARQKLLTRVPSPRLRFIIDEAALRRQLPDAAAWGKQLARLVRVTSEPHIAVQVLPNSAGLNDLLGGALYLLRLPLGRAAAYSEGAKGGELIEDADQVERVWMSYDAVRDKALSPQDSVAFIEQLMEDLACVPPESS